MKNIKNLITCLLVLAYLGCTVDERGVSFINNVPAPSNVAVAFIVTQDNTGFVKMTPSGDGATSFKVFFGDGSGTSVDLSPGESAENTYEEGSYEVRVIATGINGLTTELIQPLVVSFQAPQNLVVNIENDGTLTKTVNLTATADFAITYEVDFGENIGADPTMANIGDSVSYTYQEAGIYTIVVTAMGAAIETTEYSEDFEVTAIVAPVVSAPTPPDRAEEDVISIFSAAYNDVPGSDYFPDWGQGGCCGSGWALFDLDGDEMLQYTNLSYQGNQFGSPQDVSQMEFIHLDVWTDDVLNTIEVSLISVSNGERPIVVPLTQNGWTSIDIPISDYTDQGGFTVADIHQLKYVGDPFAGGGNVFIDNVYFYKQPSGTITSMIEDFEGTPPAFISFGNIADTQVIANPDPSDINPSANVAELFKSAGSQVWAGTFFEIATPLDLVTYNKINVKTWSPNNGVVKLKIENADASITWEEDLNTTTTNTWENLLYDFSAAPVADYVRIVIFFDFGNPGDDSSYYFDDIELVNNDGGPPPLNFENFEGAPPAFISFGNIADTQVIANPDVSGANTTANVAQLTKTAGSEVWAGTFFEVAAPLDLNTYSKISVKTWSPNNGQVKLKLENADTSVTWEVDLNPSVTNAWEELVYDFSAAPVADYVRVVIFFDFGNPGDDSVYYFDEFTLTN